VKNLTLIIPAKNEKESLPYVLDEIKNLDCKKKVLLASDDLETIDAIKNLDVEIVYQDNRGFGDALISGINSVDTDYFCIFNADGSFDPSELTNMMLLIKESNSDFIFASRYQDNSGSKDDTIITLIGNTIFTLLGKIFFRLPITDILYTYVLGHTKKAKELELSIKDFGFCVELPIKAKRMNMKLLSSSSYERKRIAGFKKVSAFKDGLSILIHMIKLFIKNKK
jgi:glycosyltransferase involved in cell wall biosynthesis|tara:strand:+ start:489 stop:1163 length:675 start_codon:yes stop_codon:yes gene_type:complete